MAQKNSSRDENSLNVIKKNLQFFAIFFLCHIFHVVTWRKCLRNELASLFQRFLVAITKRFPFVDFFHCKLVARWRNLRINKVNELKNNYRVVRSFCAKILIKVRTMIFWLCDIKLLRKFSWKVRNTIFPFPIFQSVMRCSWLRRSYFFLPLNT